MKQEAISTTYRPSRALIRLLDRSKNLDYFLAFLIGAWPIGLSILIGASQKIEGYSGYLNSPNWWSLAFLLPAVLFAFRWAMGKIAPVVGQTLTDNQPPIINILPDMADKQWVYDLLRRRILSKSNLLIALILVVIVHILDMWPVVAPYVTGVPYEVKDWRTMFFLEGGISKTNNLILLVFAYSVQFSVAFLGLLTIVLFLRHNIFFMRHIYQHHFMSQGDCTSYFQIDVNDIDRCFGFRAANEAFNTQVVALMLAGAAMFLSRYASSKDTPSSILELFHWPPVMPSFSFPIAGQWLMALFWLIALAIVALPAFVKLLPRLPFRKTEQTGLSVEDYLREFFSSQTWPKDRFGKDESVAKVAAKFAGNSFWPTGDNRASILFLFSYWIFFVILLPPVTFDFITLLVTFSIYGIAAYFTKSATFWVLKWTLRYVDERLVVENHALTQFSEALEDDEKGQAGIFISYRRSETSPYARSIHESLLKHFHKDNIFIDIGSIDPGMKFGQEIEKALSKVDAVIVVIGKDWAIVADETGQPRINNPKDMVRFEVATAIKLGKRIFPVLVAAAKMPAEKDLPGPLKELAQLNAIELSEHRWDYDMNILAKALNSVA